MRHSDREHNDPLFLDEVFLKAGFLTLALHDGPYPYCIPLNFVKTGNVIYLHSAREGHKLNCIRKNPHVAFTLAADIQIDREKSTTYFKSVCGTAKASIVEDEAEKARALDAITDRYNSLCKRPAPLDNVRRVAIIRLDIKGITGKRCLPEQ